MKRQQDCIPARGNAPFVFVEPARRLLATMPVFKRALWRLGYQSIARRYPDPDFLFMNYGYADEGEPEPELTPEDEPFRLHIQLYHRIVRPFDLRGRDVLEVGSGRGGGASYLRRYHAPRRVVGLDFSERAVALCRAHHRQPGLAFVVGDAEAIPFRDGSFDVVVNVESSHCYESMPRFLAEVRRVLRPAGRLLFADLRIGPSAVRLRQELAGSGMALLAADSITAGVLAALDRDSERRTNLIRMTVPRLLRPLAAMFAGVKGFPVYERLRSGRAEYLACVLRREPAGS